MRYIRTAKELGLFNIIYRMIGGDYAGEVRSVDQLGGV